MKSQTTDRQVPSTIKSRIRRAGEIKRVGQGRTLRFDPISFHAYLNRKKQELVDSEDDY
jgi:hypothetical protein